MRTLRAITVLSLLVVLVGSGCGETTPVTDELVREAVTDHLRSRGGTLDLPHPEVEGVRMTLELERLHEGVERTAPGRFRASGDFLDPDTTEVQVYVYVDSLPGETSAPGAGADGGGVLDTSPSDPQTVGRDDFRVDTSVVYAIEGEELLGDAERARLDSATDDRSGGERDGG